MATKKKNILTHKHTSTSMWKAVVISYKYFSSPNVHGKAHNLQMVCIAQAFTIHSPPSIYLHTYTWHPWFYTYEGEDKEQKCKA